MSDRSKPALETSWGPTNPLPPPQAMLEWLTEAAARAGRASRERAGAKKAKEERATLRGTRGGE